MSYHIFHNTENFWKQAHEYKNLGYTWINEPHGKYNPIVTEKDLPVILNADDQKTMMIGVINYNRDRYFSDPEFVKLYNSSLRKQKLETINKKIKNGRL